MIQTKALLDCTRMFPVLMLLAIKAVIKGRYEINIEK